MGITCRPVGKLKSFSAKHLKHDRKKELSKKEKESK